jgi:hypothetical protein
LEPSKHLIERNTSNPNVLTSSILNSTSTNVGEDVVPQLFTLEKCSLFSHIRGEITLKIYCTSFDDVVLKLLDKQQQ